MSCEEEIKKIVAILVGILRLEPPSEQWSSDDIEKFIQLFQEQPLRKETCLEWLRHRNQKKIESIEHSCLQIYIWATTYNQSDLKLPGREVIDFFVEAFGKRAKYSSLSNYFFTQLLINKTKLGLVKESLMNWARQKKQKEILWNQKQAPIFEYLIFQLLGLQFSILSAQPKKILRQQCLELLKKKIQPPVPSKTQKKKENSKRLEQTALRKKKRKELIQICMRNNYEVTGEENEQISEFIYQRQQQFMDLAINKLIALAKISNNNLESKIVGNEARIFSKDTPYLGFFLSNQGEEIRIPRLPNSCQINLVIYPNKLERYLKMRKQQVEEEQQFRKNVEDLLKNGPHMKQMNHYLFDQDQCGVSEPVELGEFILTKRLKITKGLLKNYLLDYYPGLFAAEKAIYTN